MALYKTFFAKLYLFYEVGGAYRSVGSSVNLVELYRQRQKLKYLRGKVSHKQGQVFESDIGPCLQRVIRKSTVNLQHSSSLNLYR
jgi:hypothetical protein